jgi:hypothetical protein
VQKNSVPLHVRRPDPEAVSDRNVPPVCRMYSVAPEPFRDKAHHIAALHSSPTVRLLL